MLRTPSRGCRPHRQRPHRLVRALHPPVYSTSPRVRVPCNTPRPDTYLTMIPICRDAHPQSDGRRHPGEPGWRPVLIPELQMVRRPERDGDVRQQHGGPDGRTIHHDRACRNSRSDRLPTGERGYGYSGTLVRSRRGRGRGCAVLAVDNVRSSIRLVGNGRHWIMTEPVVVQSCQ